MALRPRDSTRTALLALLVANLLPLWGVLAGGWSVWTVLVLYWLESGIVGSTPCRASCSRPGRARVRR
jgi:hypothetical protein